MDILREKDGWGALAFQVFVDPVFFGIAFLFSLLPASFMFFRHRHVRDRLSLCLSGFTLAVVVAETIYLFNTPLRGA
jgi:hypothetical protein